ncbi:MAG: histidinol phosphate phosphatase domain-containing protein [Deltaproteobacteria bacterium]|jgi:histidinol phosphatase-like PHP family hydrolase|nr:histidinol phosphate phosphatase domain-containing protein [Deltaproteobacteria bacterium]
MSKPSGPFPVIDFHTHTIHSDGELAPAELARRAVVKGYLVLGISDHVDQSNMESCLKAALIASKALSGIIGLTLLAGVELTHIPPNQMTSTVKQAKALGAHYVIVHGESPVEPVAPGTNMAAIEAGADILAHPGLITDQEVKAAARKGIFLEISSRGGHNLGNGLVASLALAHGAKVLINSDAHGPSDILTPELQLTTALGAGLSYEKYTAVMNIASDFATRLATRAGLTVYP